MSCTQKQQLVCFPKVRVYKPWFRHFNDHKDFRNEGTVHLFSLMALFSYANFRSNERVINGDRYMEAPGQWICKLGALPRILRVHSKTQALELMEYFQNHGFLTFEILDEEKEILRFTIADWKEHCTHLQYNYYSYKGSGFFFFPLPVGRLLLKTARKEVGIVFSELDAIMDNLLTANNYSLSLNAATLRLVQGEYVTDVRFEFGTVPSGFSSVVKPTMRVQVLGTVSNGYQIINRADVGGQYLNEWQTAKTTWVTTVRRFNTTPLPKTGY